MDKWSKRRKPNRTKMFGKRACCSPPVSSCDLVIWTQSSWCCLRCGEGTVEVERNQSGTWQKADRPPRTAAQIYALNRSSLQWHCSKASAAGNNKKIKAASMGLSFDWSLRSQSWYRSLEIRHCAALYWDVFPLLWCIGCMTKQPNQNCRMICFLELLRLTKGKQTYRSLEPLFVLGTVRL